MATTSPEQIKALLLQVFEALFNRRNCEAAERFWSPGCVQQSAHIEPGREALFNLIRSVPPSLHHESQLILAEGDYVIAHGRFGTGRDKAWVAAVLQTGSSICCAGNLEALGKLDGGLCFSTLRNRLRLSNGGLLVRLPQPVEDRSGVCLSSEHRQRSHIQGRAI